MKIRSLDDYEPLHTGFLLVVGENAHDLRIPQDTTAITVVGEAELAETVGQGDTIFFDVGVQTLTAALANGICNPATSRVELWAPRFDPSSLVECLKVQVDAAIGGVHLDDEHIQVLLVEGANDDRDESDFLLGLQVGGIAPRNALGGGPQNGGAVPNVSIGDLLIAKVLPFVKPIKQYLPSSVVVTLYKMLEKIR